MDIENIDVEWKESWASKHLKTVSAFYNTSGGRMIIGRRDDGVYVGVPDIKQEMKVVADSIRDKLHITSMTVAKVIEGMDCIVIDVPKGDEIVDYDGKFYFRVGNTTQSIEGKELKKILLAEKGMQWLDQPCDATVDDLSADAFRYFMKKGKEAGRIPDSTPDDLMLALKSMGLLYEDKLTLTAALLFAKDPRRFCYGAYIKIGLFDSKGILMRDDILDRIPLILIPDEVIRVLHEKYIQPTYRYDTGTASRELEFAYPADAIRELVLNAIIHTDYSLEQEMAIYVYKNKLEIYSAGKLMDGITLDNLKTAHPSVKRNEKMANVFYSMKFVESWGQGIRKVMDGCIFNGNPEPEFSFMGPGLLVTMRSNKEVEEESVPIHIDDLDEVNRLILGMMTSNPYTNVSDMASAVGLSERTILRRIRDLKKVGLVSREGNNMSGAWVIIK